MQILSYIVSVFSFVFKLNNEPINLSNYDYPTPSSDKIIIPLITTTDIHGYAYPRQFTSLSNFSYGGASIMTSYLKALRKQWKNKLLWFDLGDKFQGGVESVEITNGTIMTEFFNYAKLDGNVLGNHEFDREKEILEYQMNISNSDFLTTNLMNNITGKTDTFNDTKHYLIKKVYEVNGIKIGTIGFTPYFSYYSKDNIYGIKFLPIEEVKKYAKELREVDKVNAVVLLAHMGVVCLDDSQELGMYNISHSTSDDSCDKTSNDLYPFLSKLEKGVIDAVLGGHVHYPGHHFINGIPVTHSKDKGVHFNVMYLPFDKTGKLINEEIQIEGPIPICDMVTKDRKCGYEQRNEKMYPFYFHNYYIRFNKKFERKVLSKYDDAFKVYKKYICKNEVQEILTRSSEENIIGNIQTDIIRNASKADFAFLNNGAFRGDWYPGDIIYEHIYNMNPFSSDVISFDVSGKDLFTLISIIQASKKKYFQTSGIRQYMQFNETSKNYFLSNITRLNGEEINPNATYKVATNTLLAQGGDGVSEAYKVITRTNQVNNGKLTHIIEKYLTELKVIRKQDFWEEDESKRRIVFPRQSS